MVYCVVFLGKIFCEVVSDYVCLLFVEFLLILRLLLVLFKLGVSESVINLVVIEKIEVKSLLGKKDKDKGGLKIFELIEIDEE